MSNAIPSGSGGSGGFTTGHSAQNEGYVTQGFEDGTKMQNLMAQLGREMQAQSMGQQLTKKGYDNAEKLI